MQESATRLVCIDIRVVRIKVTINCSRFDPNSDSPVHCLGNHSIDGTPRQSATREAQHHEHQAHHQGFVDLTDHRSPVLGWRQLRLARHHRGHCRLQRLEGGGHRPLLAGDGERSDHHRRHHVR